MGTTFDLENLTVVILFSYNFILTCLTRGPAKTVAPIEVCGCCGCLKWQECSF